MTLDVRTRQIAALTPLFLASAYALLVAMSPDVPASQIVGLALQHLKRCLLLLSLAAAPALIVVLLGKAVRGDTEQGPLAFAAGLAVRRWREDRLASVIVPALFFALMLASFTSFKQNVLPLAGFGLDPAFAAADRALFLGVDPWRITHAIVPSAVGTWLIDLAYMLWFLPMLLFVLLSFVAPLRLRTRYLIAFALVWIVLGSVMAFALPGAGPCYYDHFHGDAAFQPLMDRLGQQRELLASSGWGDLKALLGQEELLRAYEGRNLMAAGGISAMPSLHNALATLFACAAFQLSRRAGYIFAAFAFLIWFGSVHLGWHYAIDGIVGATGALILWRISGLATDRLLAPRTQAAWTVPELAEA